MVFCISKPQAVHLVSVTSHIKVKLLSLCSAREIISEFNSLKITIEMHWTVLFLFGVVYNVAEASCPDEEGPRHIFYLNNNVTAEPGNTDVLSVLKSDVLPLACPVARNCKEWLDAGITKSGIYPVDPDGQGSFQVSITTIQ